MPPAILEGNIIGTDQAFLWMHHTAFCIPRSQVCRDPDAILVAKLLSGIHEGLVTIVVCSLVQLGDGKTINIPIGTKTTCRVCWIGDSLGVQYSTWMLQYIYVMYADIDLDFSKYLKVKSIQLRQNYFLKCINRGIF